MNEQQMDETAASGSARAVVKPKKSISIVWIVPLVALLIGGWLAYKAITEKGPTITITFKSAEGLEAGKTKIKFKDVEVGQVEEIRLSPDLSQVVVTAQLTKDTKDYLSENTRFWVVRARVAGGGVSGLGTLFSGAYIGMDPGKPGKKARSFKGLEMPPIVTTDLPGRHFMLKPETRGSLDVGDPVYFRQIQVGQVVAYEMEKDGQAVDIKIFIHAPHHERVCKTTRFWNAGGLDVSVDAGGIKVNTESFVTIMIGGIAFETPMDSEPGPAAQENEIFRLYDRREDIYKRTYVTKTRWLLHFQGSVGGLSVGAPVKFKGIKIGEVIDIKLEFDNDAVAFRIPVEIEIEPERIAMTGKQTIDRKRGNEFLVEKGLRAQLKQGNLLTGQLYIDLDMYPHEPPRKIVYGGKYPELPTIPTPIEEITKGITRIVDRLEKLPLEQIGNDLRDTLAHLNKSTEQLQKLMQNIDEKVAPAATATLEKTETTLTKLDRLLDAESPTGHELKRALAELADAARNISVLADYLERHPDSLVFGKEKHNEK
ncbi:MAG: paraquat-inducible protein B [Desulfobacteraceae bacterium Eth-SRB2]|nr:MAG: paraquat-inducible protein B [Desulfobacteraceae bacterium Eth-SRB2]